MSITAHDIGFSSNVQDDERRARRVALALENEYAKREARRLLDTEARRELAPPAFETLRERLARPRIATRWRIEGWQPRDTRLMLAAQYKAGKTTLVGGLLRSLIDGDAWLGRAAVDPIEGTVAVIDTEMSAVQLDDWLGAQRIRHDDRVLVVPLRGRAATLDLVDPATRAEWARRLKARQVSYVVLDCLRPILDALGLDEHNEAGRFLVAFDALLEEAGISEALLVHHMGHAGERSRGDSRLRDWPDGEITLVRQDENPSSPRFIKAFGRDVDVSESLLLYDQASRRLTIAGGSRHDVRLEAALEVVLELLGASERLSGRAIKHALLDSEHGRDTIDAALAHGVQTGALCVEEGPRRARLYRSVRVSGSVRPVSEDTACECPAAFNKADTPHTHMGGSSVRTENVERPGAIRV